MLLISESCITALLLKSIFTMLAWKLWHNKQLGEKNLIALVIRGGGLVTKMVCVYERLRPLGKEVGGK